MYVRARTKSNLQAYSISGSYRHAQYFRYTSWPNGIEKKIKRYIFFVRLTRVSCKRIYTHTFTFTGISDQFSIPRTCNSNMPTIYKLY